MAGHFVSLLEGRALQTTAGTLPQNADKNP